MSILLLLSNASDSSANKSFKFENVLYLKKFPKIGDKLARQMILDLKGKLVINNNISVVSDEDELLEALKGLGYKDKDIKAIIGKVNKEERLENQIKEALRLLVGK